MRKLYHGKVLAGFAGATAASCAAWRRCWPWLTARLRSSLPATVTCWGPRTASWPLARAAEPDSTTRQTFRKKLREGQLADREIEIDLARSAPQLEIMRTPGMD